MIVVSTWKAKKKPGTVPVRIAAWISGSGELAPSRVRYSLSVSGIWPVSSATPMALKTNEAPCFENPRSALKTSLSFRKKRAPGSHQRTRKPKTSCSAMPQPTTRHGNLRRSSEKSQATQEVEVYSELLDAIEKHGLDANVSLKLTQLGLDLSEELCTRTGNRRWFEISQKIEQLVKAQKNLNANVDFYSATTYYALGIPVDLFTPVFAVSRMSGWTAHVLEQYANNRLIRPRAEYIGPAYPQPFVPLDRR